MAIRHNVREKCAQLGDRIIDPNRFQGCLHRSVRTDLCSNLYAREQPDMVLSDKFSCAYLSFYSANKCVLA